MRKLTEEETKIVDEICDLFTNYNVSPSRGRELLMYVAGISAGKQDMPLTETLEALAIGWTIGVKDND